MNSEEVERLTRARRRSRGQEIEKKPFLSKTSIEILVVASALTLLVYIAGRV